MLLTNFVIPNDKCNGELEFCLTRKQTNMKIAFDAKRLYNNFTGLGNHSRTTIDILTDYFPEEEYLLFTPKIKNDAVVEQYLTNEHCRTFTPEGILKGSIWRTLQIGKKAKKEGADIFHGLSNELPMNLDIPSVVTIHDVAFHTFTDMYHWQDRQIYDLKWRYACKKADRIIAISECTKRDIIRFYGVDEKKIDVVYQPVNPLYYEEKPAFEEKHEEYMLYVGSINSRKNLLGIVKAIEMLPKDLQLPLVVVGNGREYKRQVEEYIAEHGLQNLVKFHAPINDQRELCKLYQGATLFVYPSFYEGFGLPVVEAMLSGCPVVTSNVSSLPEAGGPFSLKANPESAEEIAQQMQRLLENEELRKEISEKSYAYAMETFHPKVLAKQLMDVYESVLGK